MSTQEEKVAKQTWIPQKERIWVFGAIAVSVILVLWQLWSMYQLPSSTLHSRSFEHTYKDYGSNARLALFFVLANYVLAFFIKQRVWGYLNPLLKKWIAALFRFVKNWHTPVAILAIAFILIHAVAVFMYGFKFDFHNISGLLALIVLLPVPVSGLLRYKRLDRKWHLRFGLAFAVLFLIHAYI
ncbi:hypothetical protein [Paenibacillus sp. N3.4]|uniref:hypothetical protein n=1 Tax=Paenibacillus sp. N3.4 TaxID=2603222 RepID=UPI0011C814F2|nr:hypothetical protein [Paenibacillus sp. N3.4]TXK73860.1 hypothetical protein FU659_30260 [Paenibacillus sp. N3.4]